MKKEKIEITLTYGSEFQREVWSKMIVAMLHATKLQMESKHKKNSLDYSLLRELS